MGNNPNWNVTFSLKHVLLWVGKALAVFAFIFSSLTLYTPWCYSPAVSSWVNAWYDSQIPGPFFADARALALVPALALFMVISIGLGIAVGYRAKADLLTAQTLKIKLFITASLLVLSLVFIAFVQVKLSEISSMPAFQLVIYAESHQWPFDFTLSAYNSLYCSLVSAFTYSFAKYCTRYVLRKNKNVSTPGTDPVVTT